MSRIMSHREMKAAQRVIGNVGPVVGQLQQRVRALEAVIEQLLAHQNLTVIVRKGNGERPDRLELVDKSVAAAMEQARQSSLEVREIPADEEAAPAAPAEQPATV